MDRKYHFPQIEELKEMMVSLVFSLKEKIEKEEYDLIIGDDISGRIPTIAIKKIFDLWPGSKKPIRTFFTTSIISEEIKKHKEKFVDTLRVIRGINIKRALLVTEYISSGGTIDRLAKCLNEAEIPFDIASLSVRCLSVLKLKYPSLSNCSIFCGRIDGVPSIWNNSSLAGVEKGRGRDIPYSPFSQLIKKDLICDFGQNHYNQKTINLARRDTMTLVKEVMLAI